MLKIDDGSIFSKKILLVNPIKDNLSGFAIFPPIGLGYIAQSLRQAGFNCVKIIDCLKDNISLEEFKNYINAEKPDVVGFTVFSLALKNVINSAKCIKESNPKCIIVIGGPHPSAIPQRALEYAEIDYAIAGEGEQNFPMLMKYYFAGQNQRFSEIPGLIYRQNNTTINNSPVLNANLDSIAFPAWDLIRPDDYFGKGVDIKNATGCILLTRGCPFECSFCSVNNIYGRRLRSRSLENAIEEIELLNSNYGITRFVILDENFTANPVFVTDFCNRLIDLKKKYIFVLPNGVRLDTLNESLLRLMLRAGFSRRLAVGIESGSERILKKMNKRLTLLLIKQKLELMVKLGFRPIGYFIIGYPEETVADIMETIRFAKKSSLYEAAFTCYLPMPGTKAFDYIVEQEGFPLDFDFTKLSTDMVNYSPKGITKQELLRLKRKALLSFYMRPRQISHMITQVEHWRFFYAKFFSIFFKNSSQSYAKN